MSEAVFRSAAAPAPAAPTEAGATAAPVTPGEARSSDDSSMGLFATYEESAGRPYAADYFESPNIWDKDPGLSRDMREIEGYVREQVRAGKVEDSTKAADSFLKELERKAGLSRYEGVNQRITKILAYIDFRRTVDG